MIESDLPQIIDWWEKKRMKFNLIVLLATIWIALLASDTMEQWDYMLIRSVIWLFGANVFFTMSWAGEILVLRKFKKIILNDNLRLIIFIIGCFFSFIWTFINI